MTAMMFRLYSFSEQAGLVQITTPYLVLQRVETIHKSYVDNPLAIKIDIRIKYINDRNDDPLISL